MNIVRIVSAVAAASLMSATSAFAGVTPNLLDSNGNPVRDNSGACAQVLTSVEHPDCVAKKAPPAAPPAPAPVAPPAAPAAPAKPAEPAAGANVAKAPETKKVSITIQAEALFDFDKSLLKPAGRASIDDAIAKMKTLDVTAIIATGHTDSRGTDEYNQRLSERRATTVKDYMVSKGVPAAKITTQGKGETQPVATNKTDEGRAKNRRVDIEFTGVSQ
jgi:OmpA-OmpF porin, OOP family